MLTVEHIALLCPPSGRRPALVAALEALHRWHLARPQQEVLIVEVGASRDGRWPYGCLADGWSTRCWCWYASAVGNGRVLTLDPDINALDTTKRICGEWWPFLVIRKAKAQEAMGLITRPISLLYLDGPSEADTQLSCWRNVLPDCRPPLVLIDDCHGDGYSPKGTLVVPVLLRGGYEIAWRMDGMILLQRKGVAP